MKWFVASLKLVTYFLIEFFFLSFQIAYRTASTRFPGKLSELFLVLSDDYPARAEAEAGAGAEFQTRGRGQKHRLEDDQMSVESHSKRPDHVSSAEKNRTKKKNQTKSKAGK